MLRALAKRTARQLQDGLPQAWKWNGRDVFIADGSHVSMPDTQQNQAAYPQVYNQEPGIGFPLARLTVLLSLATGACHDLAIAPYAGKGTGETTLLAADVRLAVGPATWSWPTPCSTTTSSPGSCANAASSLVARAAGGARGHADGAEQARRRRSSSGSGPTSRAA